MDNLSPTTPGHQPFNTRLCVITECAQIRDVRFRFTAQPFAHGPFRALDRFGDGVRAAVSIDNLAQAQGEPARFLPLAPIGHRCVPLVAQPPHTNLAPLRSFTKLHHISAVIVLMCFMGGGNQPGEPHHDYQGDGLLWAGPLDYRPIECSDSDSGGNEPDAALQRDGVQPHRLHETYGTYIEGNAGKERQQRLTYRCPIERTTWPRPAGVDEPACVHHAGQNGQEQNKKCTQEGFHPSIGLLGAALAAPEPGFLLRRQKVWFLAAAPAGAQHTLRAHAIHAVFHQL
jgi:hypothetical protein